MIKHPKELLKLARVIEDADTKGVQDQLKQLQGALDELPGIKERLEQLGIKIDP